MAQIVDPPQYQAVPRHGLEADAGDRTNSKAQANRPQDQNSGITLVRHGHLHKENLAYSKR